MSPTPSPISDELIGEAYTYWLTKRDARNMPSRVDIEPSELTRVLPHVMLVDVLGPHRYRLRLVGTACTTAHGADATGKTLDDALKDDEYRAHVIGLYDKCVAERRPLYSESLLFRNGVDVDRHVKVIFLPLSNDGAMVNMVFVVQVIEYGDDLAQKNHLTAANPHKEIVHVLL
jgi:hypothetical protein